MYIAALDIGGTKTIAAILDKQGTIIARENFPSIVSNDQEHLERCVLSLKQLMRQNGLDSDDFAGLGVSLPGIVDHEKGILIYAPYAGWKNIPVADYLSASLGIQNVRCENDVNACAIGEQRFGLGSRYKDFAWMTVSTGVGGAVVSGSKLVRGSHGFAGELGHLKVEYENPQECPCGQSGCLEAHGSGTALIRAAKRCAENSAEFAEALKKRGLKADGAGCAALARAGNKDALQIIEKIGMYLGRGISYCVNILDVEAVVIGGGVAASLDLLLPSIQASLQKNAFGRMQNIAVMKTPLGYEAALLGAAVLILEE